MKRFEEPKSGHPSTIHHQNKKKVSALKSEILIKYKKIKWTPSCKATLLLLGGKFMMLKKNASKLFAIKISE